MRLSQNFILEEFYSSGYANRHGINNYPPNHVIKKIKSLVCDVMQPFRDYVKYPIRITSGYRCSKVNAGIGGSNSSHHVGNSDLIAIDFKIPGMNMYSAYKYFYQFLTDNKIDITQLILEFYNPELKVEGWIHMSRHMDSEKNEHNRNELLWIRKSTKRPSKTVKSVLKWS